MFRSTFVRVSLAALLAVASVVALAPAAQALGGVGQCVQNPAGLPLVGSWYNCAGAGAGFFNGIVGVGAIGSGAPGLFFYGWNVGVGAGRDITTGYTTVGMGSSAYVAPAVFPIPNGVNDANLGFSVNMPQPGNVEVGQGGGVGLNTYTPVGKVAVSERLDANGSGARLCASAYSAATCVP
jgi:hypothetical protein